MLSNVTWRDVKYIPICDSGERCHGGADQTYRGKVFLSRCKEFCYRELSCVAFKVSGCKDNSDNCGSGCWLFEAKNLSNHSLSADFSETTCNDHDDLRCYKMTGDLRWRQTLYSTVMRTRNRMRSNVSINLKHPRPLYSFDAKIRLPYFDKPATLQEDKKWMVYLQLLYGRSVLDPLSFPIDFSKVSVLYPALLKRAQLNLYAAPVSPAYQYARHYCWSALHPEAFLIYQGDHTCGDLSIRKYGLPSYSNVEVMHMGGPAQTPWEGRRGYWMYGMLGTGIYYNLGKTAVFETHAQAVKKFLGISCGGQCEEHYLQLYEKAGLTHQSLQFTKHCDQHCNQCSYEILDLHGRGVNSCSINFSVGFGGRKRCACKPLQFFLHCTNFGTA